jgi:hypothetical protein
LSSRTSASSAARRATSFSIIAIAATFAPGTRRGVASGARHDVSKGLETQATLKPAITTQASTFSDIIALSSGDYDYIVSTTEQRSD